MRTWGRDVHGATLGLVGFGAIGRAIGRARRAGRFAMDDDPPHPPSDGRAGLDGQEPRRLLAEGATSSASMFRCTPARPAACSIAADWG